MLTVRHVNIGDSIPDSFCGNLPDNISSIYHRSLVLHGHLATYVQFNLNQRNVMRDTINA